MSDSTDTVARGSIVLRCRNASVTVEPGFGGRLSSWHTYGHELLWQPDGPLPGASHPFGWGSFVMAPYAGRIRCGRFTFEGREWELPTAMPPHAIHGTLYDVPWQVRSVDADDETALCEMTARLVEPWPFRGLVRFRVRLMSTDTGSVRLAQHLTLEALDAMPATIGWHPWFPRFLADGHGPLSWEFDRDGVSMLQRDPEGIATGSEVPVPPGPWDDCFVGVGDVTLRWPGAVKVRVRHDCPTVVLFDGLDHAVCVEPQTGPPNAPELWPERCLVPAGGAISASTTWEATQLHDPDQ